MKRWAFGSIAFFATLGVGVSVTWLFVYETSRLPSVKEIPDNRETVVQVVESSPVAEETFETLDEAEVDFIEPSHRI